MNSNSFQSIKRAVQKQNFKNKKLDALKSTLSCSRGYLSADQVAQLVPEFTFDDDKEKAVEICAPRLYSITCDQAASILRVFSFAKSKIKALEAIAGHINDNNQSALESAFDFSKDKERAKEIVKNRTRSGIQRGPHPGVPPQAGVYPSVGPPPGGFPAMTPQPGLQPGFSANDIPGMVPQSSPQPGFPARDFPGMDTKPVVYPEPAPYPVYPGQSPYSAHGAPGPVPSPMGSPGGAFNAMEGMMNAIAGSTLKEMSDLFGTQDPAPGGYYPPSP